MIRLTVLSRQGVPVDGMFAEFGPQGGTIGRAESNTLVLDDPERVVSRVHAQVVCRAQQYCLVDCGSNPVMHNGHPLGSGCESVLADGDRLLIGAFELAVQFMDAPGTAMPPLAVAPAAVPAPAFAAATALNEDPFANLLEGLVPPAAAPPVPPPVPPDPLADRLSNLAIDPSADLLAPSPSTLPLDTPVAGSAGGLADLSDLVAPAGQDAHCIDKLFGTGEGIGGDPLALSPLADPLLGPNTAVTADPLAVLIQEAAPTSPPPSDHLPIEKFGFLPPKALSMTPAQALLTPAPVVTEPAPVPPAPASAHAEAPVAAQPTNDPPEAPGAEQGYEGELLAALLRGLHDMQPPIKALTPGLMERIGVLLRTATEGTLHLLLARQELKREVRAEVTIIAAHANNPLKFSPTVEIALAHLLGPGVRGFMPAEAAMRDAFDDLRAHQIGIMAGLRAVLAQLFERFAPQALENKIAARSAFDNLFAAGRKARLWDQFTSLYAELAQEAEDDFQALFAQAFTEAYEAQMAKVKGHS